MEKKDYKMQPEEFFKNIEIEFLIHELKDPISIIETSARTLLEKRERYGSLTERQEKSVNRVVRNARKAREMLYSLLEVGRSENGNFNCNRFSPAYSAFDVLLNCLEIKAPAISEAFQQYTQRDEAFAFLESRGICFRPSPETERVEMYQDEEKFRQIIGNLLKNGLHFRRNRIEMKMHPEGKNLVLEVIDDGPGLAAEDFESIFQRYAQVQVCSATARNGHGLGLAGSRVIARCLGGELTVASEKGKGACFRLILPLNLVEK